MQTKNKNQPVTVPNKFIYHLRKNGLKVRLRHYRYAEGPEQPMQLYLVNKHNRNRFTEILNFGGVTEIDVTFNDGKTYTGEAKCSLDDTYCKRVGAYLAFKRAAGKRIIELGF
jgi:hypothetical protein